MFLTLQSSVARSLMLISAFLVVLFSIAIDACADPTETDYGVPSFRTDFISKSHIPTNSPNDGSANYSIPINVPPGRNAFVPKISLSYNSNNGNGIVGVGWRLNIERGAIQVDTKNGTDYYSGAEKYILDDGTEIVRTTDGGSHDLYYSERINTTFAQYYYYSLSDGWRVSDTKGNFYYYGSNDTTKVYGRSGWVYKWLLERAQDCHGNTIEYSYDQHQQQQYITQISYQNNRIEFEYDETGRSDKIIDYKSQRGILTAWRLRTIRVYSSAGPVWTYALGYDPSPSSGKSRLRSVTINNLPPIRLSYRGGALGGLQDGKNITTSAAVRFADINGDGRSDMVWNNYDTRRVYARLAIGNGNFGSTESIPITVPSDLNYITTFHDVDGDGLDDCVQIATRLYGSVSDNLVYFYHSNGDGTFQLPARVFTTRDEIGGGGYHFQDLNNDGAADYIRWTGQTSAEIYSAAPGTGTFTKRGEIRFDNNYSGVRRIVDINCDRQPDFIVVSGNQVTVYLGNFNSLYWHFGSTTDYSPPQWCTGSTVTLPSEFTYDRYIHFSDANGDGVCDIIIYKNNTYTCFFATGTGSFTYGGESTISDGSWLSQYTTFADMNGDGLADLIRQNYNTVHVNLCRGDGTFSTNTQSTNVVNTEPDRTRFHDIDGDGTVDYIKQYGSSNTTSDLYLSDGGVPDLLSSVENPFGASIDLQYRPSPEWTGSRIPFVLNTVSQITVDDGIGTTPPSTTSYSYQSGRYVKSIRELWGFARSDQNNPDGTSVINHYAQDTYQKYRLTSSTLYAGNGSQLKSTSYTLSTHAYEQPSSLLPRVFVKLQRDHTIFEGNSGLYSRNDYTYNNTHGGILTITTSGTDANTFTTSNDYHRINGRWHWEVSRTTITDHDNTIVRQTDWDWATYNNGNLRSETKVNLVGADPDIVKTMTYYSYGNVATITDGRGNVTTYHYDPTDTYVSRIDYPDTTDHNGNVTSHSVQITEYDYRFGKPMTVMDENNQSTTYSYDNLGRPRVLTYPDGGRTEYTYIDTTTPHSVRIRRKVADGLPDIEGIEYFDGLGRSLQMVQNVQASQMTVTKTHYDNMGRPYYTAGPFHRSADAFLNWTPGSYPLSEYIWKRVSYDGLGRPTLEQTRDEDLGTISKSYSYSGFETTISDPDSKSIKQRQDHLGRIIEVTEYDDQGAGFVTSYFYNAAGDLESIVRPGNVTTSIAYNTIGLKNEMNDPDIGVWNYGYDANGNLETQTDYKTQQIVLSYDALNRLVDKTYSNLQDGVPTPDVAFDYDNNAPGAYGIGQLYRMTNGSVTTTYNQYDPMGRALTVTQNIAGDQDRITSHQYDQTGKLTRTTFPDTAFVDYDYHPGTARLHHVYDDAGAALATFANYHPTGAHGEITYGNGVVTTFQYNDWSGRLNNIATAFNTATYVDKQYQYTPAGDVDRIIDNLSNDSFKYDYDSRHRLIREFNETGIDQYTPVRIDFEYNDSDHFHGATDVIVNGGQTHFVTYDDNGNMESGPDLRNPGHPVVRNIVYNGDNMAGTIQLDGLAAAQFMYDGRARRAKKTAGGKETFYIGDHYEVIRTGGAETDRIRYVFAGNLRIAGISSSQGIRYYHKDHLGSSIVLTDAGGAKLPGQEAGYLPFGGQRGTGDINQTSYKYTDQEWDGETGLYNYDARLYDPVVGRFLNADSIVPDWYDPQALNRYAYCRNNPLKYVDPTGHLSAETGLKYDFFETTYLYTGLGPLDQSVMPIVNETGHVSGFVFNVVLNGVGYLHDAESWFITDVLGGDPIDVDAFDAYMLLNGAALTKYVRQLRLSRVASKSGYTLDPKKFDFFFGRVKTGREHNILRSAQNKADLAKMGITKDRQLVKIFDKAVNAPEVYRNIGEHGTTIARKVRVSDIGSIEVKFFYEGGNLNTIPKITSLTPKIHK